MTLVIYNHFRYFYGIKKKKNNAGYPRVKNKYEVSTLYTKVYTLLRLHIQRDSLEGFTPSGNLADSSSIFLHALRNPPKHCSKRF